jgi:phosphoribosyl-ATP pyrophosphohydrolase
LLKIVLLAYADTIGQQLIADGKRRHEDVRPVTYANGVTYRLQHVQVLQDKLDHELNEEFHEALVSGDPDEVAGEMADILYYAVQLNAINPNLDAVNLMLEVILPSLAPFGWGEQHIAAAALAKYAIRAENLKDHAVEAVAIRAALQKVSQ